MSLAGKHVYDKSVGWRGGVVDVWLYD